MAQVRPGDTLCAVARRHGLGLGDLLDRNPGYRSAGAILRVGAQLRVPLPQAAPGSAAAAHRAERVTVGPGDTLFRLSQSNNVPVAAIQAANGLEATTIRLGASLVLPAAARVAKLGGGALPALPSRRTHRRLYGSGLQAATAIGGEARDAAVALFGRTPRLHFSARAKNKLREASAGLLRVPAPAAAEAVGRSLAQAVASGLRWRFSGFRHPLDGDGVLTSRFGMRWGRMHEGVDIAAPTGTSVSAARAGEVTYRSYEAGGYGNILEISHGDGMATRYAHCERMLPEATVGARVEVGQQIATVGNTGMSTGPHLHFEVRNGPAAVDPERFVRFVR